MGFEKTKDSEHVGQMGRRKGVLHTQMGDIFERNPSMTVDSAGQCKQHKNTFFLAKTKMSWRCLLTSQHKNTFPAAEPHWTRPPW